MANEEKNSFVAPINWYPGHMEKARREMQETLKSVDLIIELRDARLPLSSRNPLLHEMANNKPILLILTKKDRADEKETNKWLEKLNQENPTITLNVTTDSVKKIVIPKIEEMLKEKRERALRRGIRNKILRVMVVGIPNVGKSTFINRLSMKSSLKAENRPGVTRSLSLIRLSEGISILDTPGVLWPKFSDPTTGEKLAIIGSISDNAIDKEDLCKAALSYLIKEYPEMLMKNYGITSKDEEEAFNQAGLYRHWIKEEGLVDNKRCADLLLNEFRNDESLCISWEKVDA